MGNAKHTPSPLCYRKDTVNGATWILHKAGRECDCTAVVFTEGDARLYAVSPALYASLDSLVRWLKARHESNDEFYLQSLQQAEAALAELAESDH